MVMIYGPGSSKINKSRHVAHEASARICGTESERIPFLSEKSEITPFWYLIYKFCTYPNLGKNAPFGGQKVQNCKIRSKIRSEFGAKFEIKFGARSRKKNFRKKIFFSKIFLTFFLKILEKN